MITGQYKRDCDCCKLKWDINDVIVVEPNKSHICWICLKQANNNLILRAKRGK